ncbi:MAG: hypothetical protein IPK19_39410 [Chloroflexi bacterium]|nr:hypothetical protein [Chloroflexota bacterium]
MKIAFYGDSLTDGYPGVSYFKLLEARLRPDTLLNFGRFNDTAISLHRRIITRRLLRPVDVSVVWVGVNDVLVGDSRLFSRLRRWWARDEAEFRIHTRALLDLLTEHTGRLIAVTPALANEQVGSPSNQRLARLGAIINELAAGYGNVEVLDMHALFVQALGTGSSAAYRPPHPLQSVVDALTLRTPERVDAAALERGLRLTLDGVHLNSAGARLAADAIEAAIYAAAHDRARLVSPDAEKGA